MKGFFENFSDKPRKKKKLSSVVIAYKRRDIGVQDIIVALRKKEPKIKFIFSESFKEYSPNEKTRKNKVVNRNLLGDMGFTVGVAVNNSSYVEFEWRYFIQKSSENKLKGTIYLKQPNEFKGDINKTILFFGDHYLLRLLSDDEGHILGYLPAVKIGDIPRKKFMQCTTKKNKNRVNILGMTPTINDFLPSVYRTRVSIADYILDLVRSVV